MMRLIVFDMDGTLVDSQSQIVNTMTQAFISCGLDAPDAARVRRMLGLDLETILGRLLGNDDARVDELVCTYREIYHRNLASDLPEDMYPGMGEALEALRLSDWTLLGIATGKGRRGVDRVLNHYELTEAFSTIQTPDTNPSKPDPGMLFSAGEETGVAMDRTVMIGDTTFDMQMARAAGAFALGVAWGYHDTDEIRQAGAHMIVDKAADLPGAINELVEPDA